MEASQMIMEEEEETSSQPQPRADTLNQAQEDYLYFSGTTCWMNTSIFFYFFLSLGCFFNITSKNTRARCVAATVQTSNGLVQTLRDALTI
ncbi:hypothetical protein Hanom_Chr13g01222071 [Helianthus anomalus]